ncbi:MAG: dihydroorotate dehydrogenase [Acidimicrobiaceae bacterium]|nr:dihydroorotate dehydrogenase [Acidimicrobiaceae bacterium]
MQKPPETSASSLFKTVIGSVCLRSPVMTASGTAGRSNELGGYGSLDQLGAVVIKSLSAESWVGNKAPRLAPVRAGMINSVGLQGPGVSAWLDDDLPALADSGADVVASIWGTTVGDYRTAAEMLQGALPCLVAVEVNLSCPNTSHGRRMFSHSLKDTEEVMEATEVCGLPRWAKLSPNTADISAIAAAAVQGGASAVVLTNTLTGMVIDIDRRRPHLGGGGGGVSGAALHPVAVRAVYDVHRAFPELPIIGVGGVASGEDAVELILAGASAVQVGTAIFADPRAPWKVLHELQGWLNQAGVEKLEEVIGAAHS